MAEGFIPPRVAQGAQEALLGVLQDLLDFAADRVSRADAMDQMTVIAQLCGEASDVARVVGHVRRRRRIEPESD